MRQKRKDPSAPADPAGKFKTLAMWTGFIIALTGLVASVTALLAQIQGLSEGR